MHRVAELVFFRLSPDPTQPDGREEGDIENRHRGQGKQVDHHGERVVGGSRDRADEDDHQKSCVARGDGTKTSFFDLGAAARGDPEGDDRLEDAERPHSHRRDKSERLHGVVRTLGIRGQLDGDVEKTDRDDQ